MLDAAHTSASGQHFDLPAQFDQVRRQSGDVAFYAAEAWRIAGANQ